MRTAIEQGLKEGVFPGAAAGAADASGILWQGSWGLAAVTPRRRPLGPRTRFDLASLTKVLCTVPLAMRFVEEGRLDPEEPLRVSLPSLEGEPLGERRVGDLLAHTSGLPDWLPLYRSIESAGLLKAPGASSFAASFVCHTPLPPGGGRRYSDLGFILLGEILERKGGETLDRLFDRRIARPLGLRGVGFRPAAPDPGRRRDFAATERCPWRRRVLEGEVDDENAWAMGGVAGHAGLFGTLEGVLRFAAEVLRAWSDKRALWRRETLRSFALARPPLGWDTPSPTGSSAGERMSRRSIGHLGYTGTSLWIDLDRGVGIALLSNRVHPTRKNEKIRRFRPYFHDRVMESLEAA